MDFLLDANCLGDSRFDPARAGLRTEPGYVDVSGKLLPQIRLHGYFHLSDFSLEFPQANVYIDTP